MLLSYFFFSSKLHFNSTWNQLLQICCLHPMVKILSHLLKSPMIRTTNHHKEIKKATTFTITMMGQLVGFAKSTHWDHPFCEWVAMLDKHVANISIKIRYLHIVFSLECFQSLSIHLIFDWNYFHYKLSHHHGSCWLY